MAVLIAQAFAADDLNGSAVDTITEHERLTVGLEDNAVGNGSISINRASSELAALAQNNLVRVWRDSVSGSALAAFLIENGTDDVLSEDEEGGEIITRSGRGPIALLEEALVWHKAVSGGDGKIQVAKGRWLWKDAHPARPFVRLLEEAQARGALADVTFDFTRTQDSAGTAWDVSEYADRFNIPIGMNLLEVVGLLRDAGLVIEMDTDLVLHAYETSGTDLSGSITLAEGTEIRSVSTRQIRAPLSKSVVVVGGENRQDQLRYRSQRDSTVETAIGRRREGFFPYPRTAKPAWLKKVAQRKIDRWKKQYDGPLTLGTVDVTNKVAGVDFTVGDTVAVDITGAYSSEALRVAGITLVELENGEYDPIVDFGDQAHDPVTGQYLGGDSDGVNPCGCGSSGSGPGKGGDPPGSGGGGGTGGEPPVDAATYVLDDFDRDAAAVQIGKDGATPSGTDVILGLPDGSNVPGRTLVISFAHQNRTTEDFLVELAALGFEEEFGDQVPGSTGEIEVGVFRRYITQDWVDDNGLTGTDDTLALTRADAGTRVDFYVELLSGVKDDALSVSSDYDLDPANLSPSWLPNTTRYLVTYVAADTLSGTPAGLTQEGSSTASGFHTRHYSLASSTAALDAGALTSSDGIISLVIAMETVGEWGAIPRGQGIDHEGPWPGGNEYETAVTAGTGTFSLSGTAGVFTVSADNTSAYAALLSDAPDDPNDEPWGPWTAEAELLVRWKVSVLGDTSDSDPNTLEFVITTGDERHSVTINLGDDVNWAYMDPDQQRGLVLGTGSSTTGDFVAKTLAADTFYLTRYLFAGGFLRVKLWAASDDEPTDWDSSLEIESESLPELAQFDIKFEANDGMVFTFDSIDAALRVGSGGATGRRTVAYGDGSTTSFFVGQAFEAGSLLVWVDSVPVTPASYDASAGTFTFSTAPYGDPAEGAAGSAVIEVAYTAA